jgi:hypothetical protein
VLKSDINVRRDTRPTLIFHTQHNRNRILLECLSTCCLCSCACCPQARAPNQSTRSNNNKLGKLVSYKHTEERERERERGFSSHWFVMLSLLLFFCMFLPSLWKWLLVCCCYCKCFHWSSDLVNCMNLWMNKWSLHQWTKSTLTFPSVWIYEWTNGRWANEPNQLWPSPVYESMNEQMVAESVNQINSDLPKCMNLWMNKWSLS